MLRRAGLACALALVLSGCADRYAAVAAPTVQVDVRSVSGPALDAAAATPRAPGLHRSVGERVEVEWQGSWWPATVLEVHAERYLVHYDGYGSEWDELVGEERVRDRKGDTAEDEPPLEDDVDP
jgi:hypothetical protein